jgi:hypothetical protein
MAQPLRITFPGAFYHITARGNEWKAVFKSKGDREKFLEYLETASERSGHLFQGRHKAILIERDEYPKELSRYIHLNPVGAKRVEAPEDYLWSSYNFYIGKKKSQEWLRREFILGYFGSKTSASQKEYRKFVQSLLGQQYDDPLRDVVGSVLLGRQDFINFIKQKFISRREPDKDLPALRQLVPRVTMEVVFAEVDAVFLQAPAFSRNLKIYLCLKYTGEKLKSIGNHFGISESAVSHAANRAREQIELDRKLKKRVLTIEKQLRIASFKT